jgi:hypothetical protein
MNPLLKDGQEQMEKLLMYCLIMKKNGRDFFHFWNKGIVNKTAEGIGPMPITNLLLKGYVIQKTEFNFGGQ